MRHVWMVLTVGFALSCGGTVGEPQGQGTQDPIDYCERFGWYGDGHCDEVCDRPDPDCDEALNNGVPGRPDQPPPRPTDPVPDPGTPPPDPPPACEFDDEVWGREYVAYGDACDLIDFACAEGTVYFRDECGCGCDTLVTGGPLACLDDSKPDVDRIGNVEECTRIDFFCSEGWVPFFDDCGCGCRLACSDDFECLNGFCDVAVDDDRSSMCVYPSCDDGTTVACDAEAPTCYAGDVVSVINSCWQCRDARTCGPSMGP